MTDTIIPFEINSQIQTVLPKRTLPLRISTVKSPNPTYHNF